jgi:hypothetical protein
MQRRPWTLLTELQVDLHAATETEIKSPETAFRISIEYLAIPQPMAAE